MNTLKTQNDITAEVEEMNSSPIDYSDIPEMTEKEKETVQFYNKDFLDNLPKEMVKNMIQQRKVEAKIPETV